MTAAQRAAYVTELRGHLAEAFAQARVRDLAGADAVRDDAARGRWIERNMQWAEDFVGRVAADCERKAAVNGAPGTVGVKR